jgi:hypothetical protein
METGKSKNNVDQEGYDIFVAQGIKMASQMAPELQQGQGDKVDLLSDAVFNIVNRVEDEGAKNGINFDLAVMLHGSNEIMGYLAKAAGMELNDDQVKQAVGGLVGRYLKNAINTGKMSKEQVIKLADEAKGSQAELTKQGDEFLGGQNVS